ncbi:DNA repair protein rad52 [Aspergillus nanangensis]|uniref:RAD52 homolog n=1 Tax=Aspergillus nanangensis TaxID=2582783 RepID=A0AAD4CJV6_ASPNN|nr:DNA repair protein rad52 [Aspergillus nanangensis]
MPNAPGSVTDNPFDEPQRRMSEYTAQQIATLQARLDKKLGPEYISSRPGAAGQRVHYLAADKCINLANEIFGFNGWSSSIVNIQIDFVDEHPNTGKISLGLSVIVRVMLKDGTYHEDIGYGHIENCKGKAAAFEKAKKEGTTDALKRALRNFGNVLGNCIYDKDYVSKVTKIKTAPAKWDIEDLHRHADFVPSKKQLAPPKPAQEDDDLPPRPAVAGVNRHPNATSNFDGDGEFGSDLFDEADFGVPDSETPDEVVIGPETQRALQPPTPLNAQNSYRGVPGNNNNNNTARFQDRPNPGVVTPSKPPTTRQIPPPALNNIPNPSTATNHFANQRQPDQQATFQNGRTSHPTGQPRANPDPNISSTSAQPFIKREAAPSVDPRAQDMLPPGSTPSASFFSARAAELVRENPQNGSAAAFDPHAESPSIRKTAGVDHTKSVPISRPMLTGASPASNNTRDFVNPSTDVHRKIGVPGPSGVGSPMSRNQTTSSYRPLTRPNVDPRNSVPAVGNRASVGPQNVNGKRPPLNDVTNASNPGGSGSATPVNAVDPKRPKIGEGAVLPPLPQQQQQHPKP